jgi:hypothetical protein
MLNPVTDTRKLKYHYEHEQKQHWQRNGDSTKITDEHTNNSGSNSHSSARKMLNVALPNRTEFVT